MTRFLNLHPEPFLAIKEGRKKIEMRLYDEEKSKIQIGDEIEFKNERTKEIIKCEVIDIRIYPSFKELYEALNKEDLGYLPNQKASSEDMLKYYPLERQQKYSVMAIFIRLCNY